MVKPSDLTGAKPQLSDALARVQSGSGSLIGAAMRRKLMIEAQRATDTATGQIRNGDLGDVAAETEPGAFAQRPAVAVIAAALPRVTSPKTLGDLVRARRKALKLSQQDLADGAGVGRRFVSELENGKDTLEFGKVLAVCQAAGVDLIAKAR